MNVGHRLAAVLVWIVALGTAYSQADKANSGHAGTPASKEALVSWLRSHQMVIGFDSAGAVVKVEGRIGGDLFHEGPRPRLTHDLLAGLAMLPKLERLNLCEVTMKDEDLAGVRGFSALKELRLEGTGISGTGLRAFPAPRRWRNSMWPTSQTSARVWSPFRRNRCAPYTWEVAT